METADAAEGEPVVAVVDPLVLRRSALMSFLHEWSVVQRVRLVAIAPEALPEVADLKCTIPLVLLSLGGLPAGEAMPKLWLEQTRRVLQGTPIAVVSDREVPEDAVAAFEAGAMGFVPTSTEPQLAIQAFTFIMRGGSYFPPGALLARSPRGNHRPSAGASGPQSKDAVPRLRASALTNKQEAILLHLKDGHSNKAIARLLGLQEATVAGHMRHIMRKLGASNRTQAAVAAADMERRAA
jgi:DNA-binding NarL/FixJ family response regulator